MDELEGLHPEDALYLVDKILETAKEGEAKEAKRREPCFNIINRDSQGRPIPKRSRAGIPRVRSAKVSSVAVEVQPPNTSQEQPPNTPQQLLDQNIEWLSAILATSATDGTDETSSWAVRQKKASSAWVESRPYHIECLVASEAVGKPLCSGCRQPAVIRCRECLPEEWLCGECDVQCHRLRPLHNRETILDGFYKAIPPSTYYCGVEAHQQACILPLSTNHSCQNITTSPGAPCILINANGRYSLSQPQYSCTSCGHAWQPDLGDYVRSGYWPATIQSTSTYYSMDILKTFQELKVIAPGFSRLSFARLLDYRTQVAGRSGQVNGDALQRSFLAFAKASYEKDTAHCLKEPFQCPACCPRTLAVAADGNKKLYRFDTGSSDETPFFEGVFLAKDKEVADFVQAVQSSVPSKPGKGVCGDSRWSAARETSRRKTKLDETGAEVSVCRHGFLLRGLNMFRGEIFAYPMFLQAELLSRPPKFFAMDTACLYWPYMEKVIPSHPALQGLSEMRPFLSILHAKGHKTRCQIKWSGQYKEGAGVTTGEEVEQVNSYLSRCALTTKYMTKAARVDMLTIHAIGWNKSKTDTLHKTLSRRYVKTSQRAKDEGEKLTQMMEELQCSEALATQWVAELKKWAENDHTNTVLPEHELLQQSIEALHIGVKIQKHSLYRDNDSNQIRGRLNSKRAKDKKRLLDEIHKYNTLMESQQIDLPLVEQSLSAATDIIWPWEEHGSVPISTKKRIYDQQMLVARLTEELPILVGEMAQHLTYVQNVGVDLRTELRRCEHGSGLHCLVTKTISEVKDHVRAIVESYKTALGPEASTLLELPEDFHHFDLSSPETSDEE